MTAIPPYVYLIGVIIGIITFAYQAIRIIYSNFLAYREIMNLWDAAREHMELWHLIFDLDKNMEMFGDSDRVFMELTGNVLKDKPLMEAAKKDTERVKEILNRISDLRKTYVFAGVLSRKLWHTDAAIAYSSQRLLQNGETEDVGYSRRQKLGYKAKMFRFCMKSSKILISKAAGPPPPRWPRGVPPPAAPPSLPRIPPTLPHE